MSVLELSGDKALFEGKIQGLVMTCYEDERPLQGLIGLIDWHFHGLISRCLRTGTITGKRGECTYVPVTRHQKTYHLILAGAGRLPMAQRRAEVSKDTLDALSKNLKGLRLTAIGISKSDFGNVDDSYFIERMKGLELWTVI